MLGLCSCRQPLEHPELADPIYIDYGTQAKQAEADVKSEEKAIEDLHKSLENLKPRDSVRSHMVLELRGHEKQLVQIRQKLLFFQIAQEQRKAHDERIYPAIFEAEGPWPNPAELATYKKLRQLQTASPNWQDRVPKTNRYSKGYAPAADTKKPAEANGEGHGEH